MCIRDSTHTHTHTHTAPNVKSFRALRVNSTTFNLTLEVVYTGGGDIELFSIRFQYPNSNTLMMVASLKPVQSQTVPQLWYAIVADEQFAGMDEPNFEVTVFNAMQQSIPQLLQGESGKEESYTTQMQYCNMHSAFTINPLFSFTCKHILAVLPGPPSISLTTSTSDSLTLGIQLSDIGTAPILFVQLNITNTDSLQLVRSLNWTGNYIQGELLNVTVTDLQPSTLYTFRAIAVNSLGSGDLSMEVMFTTGIYTLYYSG